MLRRPFRLGIRARLVLLVIAVVAPFLVFSVLRARNQLAQARAEGHEGAAALAEVIAGRLGERLHAHEYVLSALSTVARPVEAEREWNERTIRRVIDESRLPGVSYLVADAEGNERGRTMRSVPAGLGVADRWYFQEVQRTRRFVIGPPVELRPKGFGWGLTLAYPVLGPDGEFRGMVGASLRLIELSRLLMAEGLPAGAVVTVLDTAGTVLARSVEAETFIGQNLRGIPGVREALTLGRGTDQLVWADGIERLAAYEMVPGAPWQVTVGIPTKAIYAEADAALRRDVVLGIVTMAVAMLVAVLISGRIARPIRALAADATALAAGDESVRSTVTSTSEVGQLAQAFNRMAEDVATRTNALRESERRARLLFDESPVPMWAIDVESRRFVAANQAALRLVGWSRDEFLGASVELVIDRADDDAKHAALMANGGAATFLGVHRHRTRDGQPLDLRVNGFLARLGEQPVRICALEDITAQLAAERALVESESRLRQAQKMEAIGQFAGGIAHDFNNILTGIIGHCDLAMVDLPSDSPSRDEIRGALDAAHRAAALTRQILAFSRREVVQPSALDATATVAELEKMLARLIGERIRLATSLDPAAGRVLADRAQFEQVLLNLVVNARDAMPDGGRLEIATAAETLGPDAAAALGVAAGRYVRVRVRDGGMGMTPEVQARIFEPFYTTKEAGHGTGLGLSTVFGIVQGAHGAVRVESAPGAGATFDVLWPEAPDGSDEAAAVVETAPPEAAPTRTVILMAEDEESVRQLTARMLRRLGFEVLAAANGEEAIALQERHAGAIDLLLTDVVMPGIQGRELASRVRALRPGIRVLFVSGYTEDVALKTAIAAEREHFLAKPFTMQELAAKVREVLDAT